MSGIDEFAREFFQEIVTESDADGQFMADVFFERFCDELQAAGDLETADRAFHLGAGSTGIRVDGYGGDPDDNGGLLSLIVADFNQSPEVGRLVATEMDTILQRPLRFLRKALDPAWRNGLEETSPGFGLADLIAQRWPRIDRVRILLISNRELSGRVEGRDAEEIDGRPVTHAVWDLRRLHRFVTVSHGREDMEIDLEGEFGGAIPILPAHFQGAGYQSYLAVVPGPLLADIYDRWGARLLEQNVRVFLQARGGVNKGIRQTLESDPAMFFAYNNGLTATAEAVATESRDGQIVLTRLRNLQIVNGGQTTASIHAARRAKVDLSRVFVQMKLSIVDQARAGEVVPRISEYANSQNRVNAADFFANHPFHVRMQGFSRRMFAPSPDGTFRETKWFYERARGQHADARALLTPAQRKKFDLENPRTQVFSKTDLAKYHNAWCGKPDKVSLGAQKNFADFAQGIGIAWKKDEAAFNEGWFREAVEGDPVPDGREARLRTVLVPGRLPGQHRRLCRCEDGARSRRLVAFAGLRGDLAEAVDRRDDPRGARGCREGRSGRSRHTARRHQQRDGMGEEAGVLGAYPVPACLVAETVPRCRRLRRRCERAEA